MQTRLIACFLLLAVAAGPAAQRKDREKDVTQKLEVPKDPPMTVSAETSRLVFDVSPLSAKGLLSQQVRDGLRTLIRRSRGAHFVKIRAFVAGSGDMRRVRDIVSETFTERRQAIPALSVVQVGALAIPGAQVVLESVAMSRRPQNPNGLAWISGQAAAAPDPLSPIGPLADKALRDLRTAVEATGADAKSVLRVTCFLSSLDGGAKVRAAIHTAFPVAAVNHLQVQRAPGRAIAECDAVVRLKAKPAEPLMFLNPEGLPKSSFYSQIALVGAERVVLTSTQMAFRFQESDARLAFDRLAKALEEGNSSIRQVAMSNIYPLSPAIGEMARNIRTEFYDKAKPPGSTMLVFEGLPSVDASFAVNVVAIEK
jgi:enamine deaminase RidA (YjgF/YER057c/UK114 family)